MEFEAESAAKSIGPAPIVLLEDFLLSYLSVPSGGIAWSRIW